MVSAVFHVPEVFPELYLWCFCIRVFYENSERLQKNNTTPSSDCFKKPCLFPFTAIFSVCLNRRTTSHGSIYSSFVLNLKNACLGAVLSVIYGLDSEYLKAYVRQSHEKSTGGHSRTPCLELEIPVQHR